jgi:hypothetical protein
MQKRSVLSKFLIVLVLALFVSSMSAQQVTCTAPVCVGSCPAGTHDCTNSWMMACWENFYTYWGMVYSGYEPLVCCEG